VNGVLFFFADDGVSGVELWKSDGTAAGTGLVKDINPGPGDSNPTALTNVNGLLVFQACEPQSGCEVWRSDGTEDGTWQLDDIVPGAASSNPSGFTRSGSLLYFAAEEAVDGRELWAIPVSALEPPPCVGNCDGIGGVTIAELITLVNIALGNAQASACPHGVPSGADVDVALIIQAVNNALSRCGG
jgi:ELWxxDGT repeat protein